jgi:hypothetical protein
VTTHVALAAAVAVCLVSAACMPMPSSSESVVWHVRGASLVGDVDGDGRRDEVAVEDAGPQSCRFRVRARSDQRTLTMPLRLQICEDKPSETWGTAHPSVIALAAIDRLRGLEIVVEEGCGAHTCFATVVGFDGRRLREWDIPFESLSYGGSVGTGARSVDCAAQKGVVISTTLNFSTSSVHRTWFRVRDGRLERIRSSRSDPRRVRLAQNQPFASCTRVGAAD